MRATLTLLTFLFLSAALFAQVLSEGSVVAFQALPSPDGHFVYDFELCCGFLGGEGGYLAPGYGYDDSYLSLTAHGYTFAAQIYEWPDPDPLSDICYVQNGTLVDGILKLPNKQLVTGLVADYSQVFCEQDGIYWNGPGALVVYTPD